MARVEFDSPGWGSEPRPNDPVTRSSSAIGKLILVGVVPYSFVERNPSSHFGFVPTSLRPLRTSVPRVKINLPDEGPVTKFQRTKKKPPNGIRTTDQVIWELQVVTNWWSCGSNN